MRPRLANAITTEAVVAVHQQHRVHQRTAANRTHQIVVVRGDIVQRSQVDGRVELAVASLLGQVVSLLHVAAGLESAHVAEGDLRRDAGGGAARRAPAAIRIR